MREAGLNKEEEEEEEEEQRRGRCNPEQGETPFSSSRMADHWACSGGSSVSLCSSETRRRSSFWEDSRKRAWA